MIKYSQIGVFVILLSAISNCYAQDLLVELDRIATLVSSDIASVRFDCNVTYENQSNESYSQVYQYEISDNKVHVDNTLLTVFSDGPTTLVLDHRRKEVQYTIDSLKTGQQSMFNDLLKVLENLDEDQQILFEESQTDRTYQINGLHTMGIDQYEISISKLSGFYDTITVVFNEVHGGETVTVQFSDVNTNVGPLTSRISSVIRNQEDNTLTLTSKYADYTLKQF